ncbi:hypothetical protein Tco_0827887 [Tanacetum coccineum]
MGDENPIHTLGDYSKPSHEGYRNTIELPTRNNVVPLRLDTIRLVQNGCSFHELQFEDPNQHLKDFLKLVDSLDLNGENRERMRIGPHDTQYCMENPEQAFVEYASSRTDEAGGKWYTFKPEQNNLGDTYNPSWKSHPNLSQSNLKGLVSNFMASQDARLSKFEANFKQQQSEMTNKINTVLKAITDQIAGMLLSDTVKDPKLGTHPVSSARSYPTIDPQCLSHPSNSIKAINAHFNEATISQTSLWQPEIETKSPQPEEPKPTLEDEF